MIPIASAWPAPVADALSALLERYAGWRDEAGRPPLAAFDFDNTCVAGDIGEAVHYRLSETMSYALDDERFWQLIAPEDGREPLRALWDRELGLLAPEARVLHPGAVAWSSDLIATYARRYRRLGAAEAYHWAARLHVGLCPMWLREFSVDTFALERARPLGTEDRATLGSDRVTLPRGIRVRPAMVALARAMQDAGWEVWVISATNQWTIEAVAPLLGFAPERVVGNRCRVDQARITDEREGPITWRQGKVDAIALHTGRPPVAAFGDTWTDVEMLHAATELALLVDRGDAQLRSLAEERRWQVVPAEALAIEEPR